MANGSLDSKLEWRRGDMEVLLRKSVRLAMDTGQWEMEQGVEKT